MRNIIFCLLLITITIGCKKEIVYNDPIPKHNSLTIASKFVHEDRIINIWTPPNYNQTVDSFPVLYMPDGGIKEDFPHVANTLAKLIKENKIPSYILVGIENTKRGRDLCGPTKIEYDLSYIPNAGGANDFRNFIKNELFIAINKKYRTSSRKAIIGESLAGLFVVETFLLDNNMFDAYIAIDPSLWFNENYLVANFKTLFSNNYNHQKKLWFANSDATDISKHAKELNNQLEQSNKNLIFKYTDASNEQHNTIFRATKEKALIWTLNN